MLGIRGGDKYAFVLPFGAQLRKDQVLVVAPSKVNGILKMNPKLEYVGDCEAKRLKYSSYDVITRPAAPSVVIPEPKEMPKADKSMSKKPNKKTKKV